MSTDPIKQATCKLEVAAVSNYRTRLPEVAEAIIASCAEHECPTHIDYDPIPSRQAVVEIIDRMRELLFPGYFNREKIDPVTLRYSLGQAATGTFDLLSEQICRSIRHDCLRYDQPCTDCENRGHSLALKVLEDIWRTSPPSAAFWRPTFAPPSKATPPPAARTRSSSATPAFTPSRFTASPTASTNWTCRCCRGS